MRFYCFFILVSLVIADEIFIHFASEFKSYMQAVNKGTLKMRVLESASSLMSSENASTESSNTLTGLGNASMDYASTENVSTKVLSQDKASTENAGTHNAQVWLKRMENASTRCEH
jgi:hypothetical protein